MLRHFGDGRWMRIHDRTWCGNVSSVRTRTVSCPPPELWCPGLLFVVLLGCAGQPRISNKATANAWWQGCDGGGPKRPQWHVGCWAVLATWLGVCGETEASDLELPLVFPNLLLFHSMVRSSAPQLCKRANSELAPTLIFAATTFHSKAHAFCYLLAFDFEGERLVFSCVASNPG